MIKKNTCSYLLHGTCWYFVFFSFLRQSCMVLKAGSWPMGYGTFFAYHQATYCWLYIQLQTWQTEAGVSFKFFFNPFYHNPLKHQKNQRLYGVFRKHDMHSLQEEVKTLRKVFAGAGSKIFILVGEIMLGGGSQNFERKLILHNPIVKVFLE